MFKLGVWSVFKALAKSASPRSTINLNLQADFHLLLLRDTTKEDCSTAGDQGEEPAEEKLLARCHDSGTEDWKGFPSNPVPVHCNLGYIYIPIKHKGGKKGN